MSISIVFPMYNEEDNIIPLLEATIPVISSITKDFEIIFVDDGSTDRTPEILKQYGDGLKANYEIWSFLTGERKSIINFAEHFGITVVQNESVPDEIAHSLRTVIVDASGKLVKVLRGNEWTPDEIIQELAPIPHPK